MTRRPKTGVRLSRALLPIFLCFFVTAPQAGAVGVGPDRSFGKRGLVQTSLGPTFLRSSFSSVGALPGGAVAVWQQGPGGGGRYLRYLPGGALEPRPDSPRIEPLRAIGDGGETIEVQSSSPDPGYVISRSLPDGSPDPGFGDGGREALPFFNQYDALSATVQAIASPPSGQVLVGGKVVFHREVTAKTINTEYDVTLLRLDPSGEPDDSFGRDGVVRLRTDLGLTPSDLIGIAPRDGKGPILAVADRRDGQSHTLLALAEDGALETGFGTSGATTIAGQVVGIRATPSDQVLAAGSGLAPPLGPGRDFFVSRFTAAGHPDLSFGDKGVAEIDLGGGETAGAVLWGDDGSALLGGSSVDAYAPCSELFICRERPVLARIDPDGNLSDGFGKGGRLHLEQLAAAGDGYGDSGVLSLAARPGGGAYAAGRSGTTAFVAALDSAGAPVADFGTAGILSALYPQASNLSVTDAAVDRRGRILVLGQTNAGGAGGVVLRYRRNGALDRAFGADGGLTRVGSDAVRVVADRRNRALVLGDDSLIRLRPSGAYDRSFGDQAVVRPRKARKNLSLELAAIEALPNGEVVVAGTRGRFGAGERMVVYRFRADGSPDAAFGHRGLVAVSHNKRSKRGGARGVLVQPDGRVVVSGYLTRQGTAPAYTERHRMVVVRLRANGKVDRSFGRRGWVLPPVGMESQADGLAPQGRKLLVTGFRLRPKRRATELLLRYHPNGRLDRRFGRAGMAAKTDRRRTSSFEIGRLSVLVTRHRLLLFAGAARAPLSAYLPNGRRVRGYPPVRRLLPGKPRHDAGPVATLQGKRPILAWTSKLPPEEGHLKARLRRLVVR